MPPITRSILKGGHNYELRSKSVKSDKKSVTFSKKLPKRYTKMERLSKSAKSFSKQTAKKVKEVVKPKKKESRKIKSVSKVAKKAAKTIKNVATESTKFKKSDKKDKTKHSRVVTFVHGGVNEVEPICKPAKKSHHKRNF
ncbi:hypothetical protein ANCDUO_03144 [Ancylostoma duodenale]|uniref:Uncharacterized protein n=1 Tax=Ancylostoma duodenale TaxID=51022 RepID=A0A0C2HAL6_9BILA|nr:hypothetical protein ANCDUO_03144 [Ancylostoma duodenale]